MPAKATAHQAVSSTEPVPNSAAPIRAARFPRSSPPAQSHRLTIAQPAKIASGAERIQGS